MTAVRLGRPAGRTRWEIEHAGRRFLVLHAAGGWVVTDALCPHRQGRLIEGIVRDGGLVCPSHWYTFDLATGACRTTDRYALGRFEVEERAGELWAELPSAPARSWSQILRAHAAGG